MDLFIYLLILAIAMIISYAAGWAGAMKLHTHLVMAIFRALGITEQQLQTAARKILTEAEIRESGDDVIDVRLEQHQGTLFAYREDTSEFLGQGTSREDLVRSIMVRLPECRIRIKSDQGAELMVK